MSAICRRRRDSPPTTTSTPREYRRAALLSAASRIRFDSIRETWAVIKVEASRATRPTTRSGRLQIAPPEGVIFGTHVAVKPEPIDIRVKVILVGDAQLYYGLDAMDPDFPNLFKVLADFDSDIPRDANGVARYAGVLSRIAQERGIPHFSEDAVAARSVRRPRGRW